MTSRSWALPGRRWPARTLVLGSLTALLVALVADTPATTVVSVLLVLSLVVMATVARREDRGAAVAPMTFRAAVASAVVLAGLLVYLAEYAVVAVAVTGVAILFALLVALLAVLVVIISLTRPPVWMLDDEGHLVGFWERVQLAWQHWSLRLRQRPGRRPETVYRVLHRDILGALWHDGGRPTAFAHLDVVVHPDTLRAIDGWMPIEDVAADLAHGYASAHRAVPRKSELVVVLISSDPAVPVGRAAVAGSFRESRPDVPRARAWAPLAGPFLGRDRDAGQRMSAAKDGLLPDRTLRMPEQDQSRRMPDPDPVDSTVYLLREEGDRTRILPETGATTIQLPLEDAAPLGGAAARTPAAPCAAGPDPSATLVTPGMATTPVPSAPGEPPMPPVLIVRRLPAGDSATLAAAEYLLDPGRAWTVGRGQAADIHVPEAQVSRQHLELTAGPRGWLLIDRSSLGTRINTRPVRPGRPTPVHPGDVLELGRPSNASGQPVLLQLA